LKNTGIVRKIDECGRIVLPMELRKVLNIVEKDPIENYTKGNSIILTKYENCCSICGRTKLDIELKQFDGKKICRYYAEKIIEVFS
jgi:transcriptional pleiotropic regulator of transition state genes